MSYDGSWNRPNALAYIERIFDDFLAFSGDRLYGDDPAIVGGIARLRGRAVTVIGQMRGTTPGEQRQYRYSMANPEGFRKSMRLLKQAEKFRRPVVCFVDTVGAYPGQEAERRGQAGAIALHIQTMACLTTAIISVLIGNGGSGGALALCVANEILMLEGATLSVISPKGCASILWKDGSRQNEAARLLKMTAKDLLTLGLVDHLLPEGDFEETADRMGRYIHEKLSVLSAMNRLQIAAHRQDKFRNIDHGRFS